MAETSETQIQTETTEKQLQSGLPNRKSGRKSILALSVFALAINGTAAVYTVIVAPRVVVDEYPVYPAPRVYAVPPVYAYAGPVWRGGWGHRRHFHGGW